MHHSKATMKPTKKRDMILGRGQLLFHKTKFKLLKTHGNGKEHYSTYALSPCFYCCLCDEAKVKFPLSVWGLEFHWWLDGGVGMGYGLKKYKLLIKQYKKRKYSFSQPTISPFLQKMCFHCCMHWEGEGGLGTDISTMASVHKNLNEILFHNRWKMEKSCFSPCTCSTCSCCSVTWQRRQCLI